MNNNKSILYLGSSSLGRQRLLKEAGIPIQVIAHTSDELLPKGDLSFEEYVIAIAREKMNHVTLPAVSSSQPIFVLTADSLVQTLHSKEIFTKPRDVEDGKRMLTLAYHEPVVVATGCCLYKIVDSKRPFKILEKREWCSGAQLEYKIPPHRLDEYFKIMPGALSSAGAGILEGYGAQFLCRLDGSYSASLGLPLFEVCAFLGELGFNVPVLF